jgi:polyketide synthase-associated protein
MASAGLVEIFGLEGEEAGSNGKKGRVSGEEDGKCLVDTFDGFNLTVPQANLKEYTPEAPEAGGFNVAWPDQDTAADFAATVVKLLGSQEYCVVQMFMSDENRAEARKEADYLKYKKMRKEFEPAYLGRQHKCKSAWFEGVAEQKPELEGVLDACDFCFSSLTQYMLPLTSCALDFIPYSRTNTMARLPFQNPREEAMRAEEVTEEDIEDGLVDSHIQFVKRRKLCFFFIVDTAGGELTLIPKDDEKDKIVLEAIKGRMIIFRNDRMSYTYNAYDTSDFVLQSWLLSEPDNLVLQSLEGDGYSKDDFITLVVGPETPQGLRTRTKAIATGFGAGGHNSEEGWWCALSTGTDGQVKPPLTRFDMDVYYLDAEEWHPGTTYSMHGGFVGDDIYALDNVFFNVSDEEAMILGPAHKKTLEKGYESMYKAGLTKATMKGRKIGLFLGHSGDDWGFTTQFTCGAEDAFRTGLQDRSWGTINGRIAFCLNLKGPQILADTACSSALVAYGIGHTMLRHKEEHQLKYSINNQLDEAVMMGCNMIPGPGNYINLCGPHMLSPMGRCFTFDHSADGFERGEGTGAFFCKNDDLCSQDDVCTMIGACLNQDGRSASMTAPNGPAQQECIKGSMREAGLSANDVTCAECHGTGTALGDPIEVGALRGVMQDRIIPIFQTSAKTHIGHCEASAGTAGVIKCMLMCAACAGSPNCHLLVLNPHLDVAGYPTVFCTELSDYGGNSGYSGVSSFGFGGANSRGDVFASANKGPHRVNGKSDFTKVDYITITCPIDEGPIHYVDGKAVPLCTSKRYHKGRYHADAIRDEFASYDFSSNVYAGEYQLPPTDAEEFDDPPEGTIYVVGSWDAFKEPREMTEDEESTGTYRFMVELGETRCEHFQLRVDKEPKKAIFPVVKNGGQRTRVVGPDDEGSGLYWLLDGRDEGVKAGTVYLITLQWGPTVSVTWNPVEFPAPEWSRSFQHTYQVIGSWTAYAMNDMKDVSHEASPNTWQCKMRLGMSGRELFRFCRDRQKSQAIYPARNKAMICAEIAVRGPDDLCNDKCWLLSGKSGDVVTIRLQLVDAHIVVSAIGANVGELSAESDDGPMRHSYRVSGSFTDWQGEPMELDESTPGIYKYTGLMGVTCQEYFSICVDGDPGLSYQPQAANATPGTSIVSGPESATEMRPWMLTCLKPGARFEIIVDKTAADKRKMVDVRWTDRVDYDSMKDAFNMFFGAAIGY